MKAYAFDDRSARRIADTVRRVESMPIEKPRERKPVPDRNYTRVMFRNDYAGTLPAYGVLRVTGATTVSDDTFFTVDRPDTSFARLYLVNGPEDVADDGFGWGTWLWHADWVLYDDASTPAFGESWGPQASSFKLKKWRYGFTIWGAATGGDTDRVMASQDWVSRFLFTANEDIAADGGTGAVSIRDGNRADTSLDLSGVVNDTGLQIDNGARGEARWFGGKWYGFPSECPA